MQKAYSSKNIYFFAYFLRNIVKTFFFKLIIKKKLYSSMPEASLYKSKFFLLPCVFKNCILHIYIIINNRWREKRPHIHSLVRPLRENSPLCVCLFVCVCVCFFVCGYIFWRTETTLRFCIVYAKNKYNIFTPTR